MRNRISREMAGMAAVAGLFVISAAVAAEPIARGPELGTKIPAFQALDHHGDWRTFENM